MHGKSYSDEVPGGNEEHFFLGGGNAGKAIIYKIATSLAELYLCPTVFWKVELVNSETRYSAEDISKRSVKGAAWLLLNAYSKMTEERNDLKIKWVIRS